MQRPHLGKASKTFTSRPPCSALQPNCPLMTAMYDLSMAHVARPLHSTIRISDARMLTGQVEHPWPKCLITRTRCDACHLLVIYARMTAPSAHLRYILSRWCETDEPPGRRWMLASMKVGRTIRLPSALMITRCPGRLYMAQNLPPRVTTS